MKTYLFTLITVISLLTSSCILANSYNDNIMDDGDSNGLVQGSSNIETQDDINSSSLDDRASSLFGAGVTRDGETMGEED